MTGDVAASSIAASDGPAPSLAPSLPPCHPITCHLITCHLSLINSAARSKFSISITLVTGPVPPGTGVSMPGHLGCPGLVAVALEARIGVGGAKVDHDGARLDPVGLDHLGAPDGDAEDVGAPADARQVDSAAVGDGDGAVAMEQQQAMGLPTMSLRPTITACLPLNSTPAFSNSRNPPAGVAGTKKGGRLAKSRPALSGWTPSTSLPDPAGR